ncbi:hypothetical protein BJY04DRAFT_78894 [Aspergillus karnatakaensis]|uniref:uncharacterized protein n=1 Tax=Aspergillus karnatakaensis TaxID=1810916 RepID=UPI003CCD38B8
MNEISASSFELRTEDIRLKIQSLCRVGLRPKASRLRSRLVWTFLHTFLSTLTRVAHVHMHKNLTKSAYTPMSFDSGHHELSLHEISNVVKRKREIDLCPALFPVQLMSVSECPGLQVDRCWLAGDKTFRL